MIFDMDTIAFFACILVSPLPSSKNPATMGTSFSISLMPISSTLQNAINNCLQEEERGGNRMFQTGLDEESTSISDVGMFVFGIDG